MKTVLRASLSILAVLTIGTQAHAANTTVIVTPADMGTVGDLNKWYLDNFRDTSTGYTSTTTAAINNANPRSGNGSVQMSSTDASGKADYVYNWGFVPGYTLGNLTALSYDWYRDGSSTSASHLAPALRIVYDADGNAATTDDEGYLIWEQVYNGPTASNQWVSSDTMSGNFWQRELSPGYTVENYNTTLMDWINGAQPAGADQLSANSAILGVQFGIGSGWSGTFLGNVDNVKVGFGGASTTFNFETAGAKVPEPGSLALLAIGVLGAAGLRRRKA